MAERIMARPLGPEISREDTASDASSLLENKLTQLNALLACFYGEEDDWFEQVGPERRDKLLWLASDLAREAEALFQVSAGAGQPL